MLRFALLIPATIAPVIQPDPIDDVVLATALSAQADAIVTRDNAVLNVKRYHDIEIVNSSDALRLIEAQRARDH